MNSSIDGCWDTRLIILPLQRTKLLADESVLSYLGATGFEQGDGSGSEDFS